MEQGILASSKEVEALVAKGSSEEDGEVCRRWEFGKMTAVRGPLPRAWWNGCEEGLAWIRSHRLRLIDSIKRLWLLVASSRWRGGYGEGIERHCEQWGVKRGRIWGKIHDDGFDGVGHGALQMEGRW